MKKEKIGKRMVRLVRDILIFGFLVEVFATTIEKMKIYPNEDYYFYVLLILILSFVHIIFNIHKSIMFETYNYLEKREKIKSHLKK